MNVHSVKLSGLTMSEITTSEMRFEPLTTVRFVSDKIGTSPQANTPSMPLQINKVAVLGAGVMGSRIAAHLANAGIPTYLLDIVPRELNEAETKAGLSLDSAKVRNRIVQAGVDGLKKAKPAAFFVPECVSLITPGNFDDDLKKIADADWIVEAVAENLEIKRSLLAKVDQIRRPDSIVSTNTSGLPVNLIAEGLSDGFRQHWLGTHFFNPPRYLH